MTFLIIKNCNYFVPILENYSEREILYLQRGQRSDKTVAPLKGDGKSLSLASLQPEAGHSKQQKSIQT